MNNHQRSVFRAVLCACFLIIASRAFAADGGDEVAAIVNGRPILKRDVDETIAARLFALEQQTYALRRGALDSLIARNVLEDEAKRQGITVETLRTRLTPASATIAAKTVDETYAAHKAAFGTMSADEARERIRRDLETAAKLEAYQNAVAKLRDASAIEVRLHEPRHAPIGNDKAPFRGPADAPVTITEFADFECPFCKSAAGVLRAFADAHENDVKLVFRNLPLEQHPHALPAAEASWCAAEQGRFWEFHDALYAAGTLSQRALADAAEAAELDVDAFDACRTSDAAHIAVAADLRAAAAMGIAATPTLVINGRVERGEFTRERLEELVSRELAERRASLKKEGGNQ